MRRYSRSSSDQLPAGPAQHLRCARDVQHRLRGDRRPSSIVGLQPRDRGGGARSLRGRRADLPKVTLPLIWPGILAGALLAFALRRRLRHHQLRRRDRRHVPAVGLRRGEGRDPTAGLRDGDRHLLGRGHGRGRERRLRAAEEPRDDQARDRRLDGLIAQVSARTPRLRSWSARMLRWISDVPSQIRSTRSSRWNRSATFSRM